jgi:hypothetical protein
MDKEFLKKLILKPDPYVKVWVWFYTQSDADGVFTSEVSFVLSRYKISRTTFQRILDFGCKWNESGMRVEREWNGNVLKLRWLGIDSGTSVESEWNESGISEEPEKKKRAPRTTKKESDKLYPLMVEEYNIFCKERLGMGAKMNALQGKSMKNIIAYLTHQVLLKYEKSSDIVDVEDSVLKAWKFILKNWGLISSYYSDQIKLNQIDSNLPNILSQLKNNGKNKRDEKFAHTTDEIANTSFE